MSQVRCYYDARVCDVTTHQRSFTAHVNVATCICTAVLAQSDADLAEAAEVIWAADVNRFPDDELVYDLGSAGYVSRCDVLLCIK